MTCLIKSKNKPLLDQYTSMLGSSDAAYYVLCKNNGYPLEFTPSGEKSDLFQKLLAKNNYDYEAAIEEKAQMYYSSYYDTIGGDWTMGALDNSVVDEKGEPIIKYEPAKLDFSDIFEQPFEMTEMDQMSLAELQKNMIDEDLDNYVEKLKPVGLEERHNVSVKWLASRQKKLVNSINKDLIEAFGLEKKVDKDGNVTFVSKSKDSTGRPQVIIQFCEYLENGKKGVYDQTGRIEAAANIIQISLTDADPSTINHELAHHYVRMFWNSEVIQAAVQKLDSGDRSEGWQVRLEEKLVDELTSRTTEAETIWDKFSDMIKTAFLWVSSPMKQMLLCKAALAFRLNDQANTIRRDQYVLSFIDPTAKRVFQSSPNSLIDGFDNMRTNNGLSAAMTQFVADSLTFFQRYIANPNSILKQEYDEYVQHVKNTLSDITISDAEFNDIYIAVRDHIDTAVRHNPDPLSYQNICAMNLTSVINEIRIIREEIRENIRRQQAPGPAGSVHAVDVSKIMEKILRGLRTRVYEYLHTVPKAAQQANAVQELLDKLNSMRENRDQLALFVSEGTSELNQLYFKLEELSRNGYQDLTPQQLQAMWNTIDGFYKPIIDIILKELGSDGQSIIHDGILYEFGVKLSQMSTLCGAVSSYLTKANKILSRRETHNYLVGDEQTGQQGVVSDLLTDQQKERFLYNFDDQLIEGKLFEDINMLQPYIGLSSRSRSTVIRVARNMILAANSEIRKASIKDAAHIMKLYFAALPEMRKLGLKEVQSVFQEMDEKGVPTGYFVRKLNYGKFYRDLDKEKDRLINEANEKLKNAFGENAPQITYDSYNNPIMPPDDDPIVKSILTEYADNLDDWMCQHSERMFVPEYYVKRREMLSPTTRRVMQDMQNRINAIMSKAPIVKIEVNGVETDIQATWELSPEDQQNLVQLQNEYKQLSNHYYSDGTKKTGDELRIAEEISAFNEWRNKKVKYVQNDAKFEAAIQKIRSKHGNNSIEESRFRKLNTSIVVNPDYYEFVMSKVRIIDNQQLDALRKRRNDLKKLIEEFDKKGIDVEQKRRQQMYWDSLKEIDAQIRELLDQINAGPVSDEEKWSTYFDTEMVMYDENETLLDHMLKQDMRDYRRTHPADTRDDDELRKELIRKYQYTYKWYDNEGGEHEGVGLVSVFTRQVPKGASINNRKMNGKYGNNVLITQYSQQFSDIDKDSELYNENFDRNDTHLVQPKHDEYQNDAQWSLIENNEKIKNLYNALIELMNRNNSKLPSNSDFSYKLPQITGRRLTILRRSSNLKEVCDALKYNWNTDWKLNERDDSDINYEDQDLKLRANGTRINTVPVRYVRPLERPEFITSDVIGSIIAFTEMANNFVVKTQLASQLEIIKQQLSDRQDPGLAEAMGMQSTTNIIKQLSNMMDDQLYANSTKLGDKNARFTRKEELMIKFFTRFQHFGRILMLGYNLTSMSVGFFESYIRGNLEAVLGKDYTLRDLMHAYGNFLKYSIPMLTQIGSVNARNKQVALMQWFGVSKRLTESYHSTERNRFIKILSENVNGMFGFTLGDYANSSFQLSMALSNVRFIEDGNGVAAGFYTKQTLIRAIQKANPAMSYREARNEAMGLYKDSGVCLEDAYDFEDGIIHVKEEYQQYITDVLENRVTGKCYQRLAEALGVVPQNDTPGYALQILLRPLGVLRSYLFTVIARNWNWAHDLQNRYIDPKGNVVKEDDMMDGYVDIDAGNMNIGLHQGLIGWMKMTAQRLHVMQKKANAPDLTDETKELYNYAAMKVGLEVLSICLLVGISTLFKAMAKGADDDDWWVRFGYLTSVRLVNSFISVLDPTAFLEVIKNISTLISPLNDLLNLITLLSDMVGLSGHSPFDEIKSGSYKGRSRLMRDLLRITPLGNAYEDLTIPALKSRANWYIQQDPLTWGSVGGAFDQLWGIGD